MMKASSLVWRRCVVALVATISVAVSGRLARADARSTTAVHARMGPVVAAMQRGDLDEVARLGGQVGSAALATALVAPDRTEALTAVAVVAARRELWALPWLAALAGGPDRRRALAAVDAALQIVSVLDVESAAAADLDSGATGQWQDQWLALAQRRRRWIDVRVASLEVAARLGRGSAEAGAPNPLAPGGPAWAAMLADPDPAMRRAVLDVTEAPLPAGPRAEVAKLVSSEADANVAASAAALVCAELAARRPPAVLTELGEAGVQRVRALASATTAATAADVELARCLRADGQRESQVALRSLLHVAKGQVQRALRSVERGGR
jgi:hypothetical protein